MPDCETYQFGMKQSDRFATVQPACFGDKHKTIKIEVEKKARLNYPSCGNG